MRAIFCFSLITFLLHGCALIPLQKPQVFPFRLLNNHILLPVTVNDKPMEFMLDTSAQHSQIFTFKNRNSRAENVVNIEIGDLILSSDVVDSKHSQDSYSSYIDGILGQDLLKNKILEITYDTQTITLHAPRLFDKRFKSRKKQWASMPIMKDAQHLVIEMPLTLAKQSQYFEFALDTGFNQDFMLPKKTLDESLTPQYSYTTPHFDVEGRREFEVYPLDRTYLGDHAIVWPMINTPIDEVSNKQTTENPHIGKIGNAVLSRFNLIIDAQRNTLYYQENQRHHVKNLPDRSGITITPHPQGAKVTSVAAKAANLLQVTDIVQSYETVEIDQNTFDGFRLMLSSEAEKLWICWLRDNEQQCGHLEMGYRM